MDLVYTNIIPAAERDPFINKVREVSNFIGINPNWLMQLMKSESGLNPQAQNIQNNRVVAVGLIQFMGPTAAGLGTSLNSLYRMNRLQQMDFVKKYFTPYRNRIKSYYDLYLVNFFPIAIGKPDDWVFQSKNLAASTIAKQNPGINQNKDQVITIKEFKQYVNKTVPAALKDIILGSAAAGAAVIVFLVVMGAMLMK